MNDILGVTNVSDDEMIWVPGKVDSDRGLRRESETTWWTAGDEPREEKEEEVRN